MPVETHAIFAAVHGRYLTAAPTGVSPVGLLVGFHGQSETAAIEMAHLQAVAGDRPWLLVSVQGLNRYYTRARDVVAAWMTREDRELAIADNIAYVGAVVAEVKARHDLDRVALVYDGFSQGTAMAYRAAAFAGHPSHGLMILAGDLPPDAAPYAANLPPVLLGRGSQEVSYTEEVAARDRETLTRAGVLVEQHVFDDGHVRHASWVTRSSQFLDAAPGREYGAPGL